MCEYCGCQSVPAIAQLTAEHDQIRVVARELDQAARRADLPVAVQMAGRLLTLLAPHVAIEERGLFPVMAGEFEAHIASLAILTPRQWDDLDDLRRTVTRAECAATADKQGWR